jgi:hypothetical protein
MVNGMREFITLLAKLINLHPSFRALLLVGLAFVVITQLCSCAAPLAVAASAGSTAGTTAAAYPVTTVSLGTTAATGKSPLEHAASHATKKDCNFFNVFSGTPVCQEIVIPSVTDKSVYIITEGDRLNKEKIQNQK